MRALIDTHCPDRHCCASIGINPRYMANGIFIDAADFCCTDRIIIFYQCRQFFKTITVLFNVVRIFQTFIKNHMSQAIKQHQVCSGSNRQVNISKLGKHSHPRINHNDWKLAFLQRFFQTPVDNGVLFGQVRTERNQAFSMFKILITTRWPIRTERTLIA